MALSPMAPVAESAPEVAGALSLLGDEAIRGVDEDRLNRSGFAGRMVQLFDNVAAQADSGVFGLLGPWGSGKSSVLHLVRQQMIGSDKWSLVEFNPWEVSDVGSLVREFMLTVTSALPSDKAGKRARKALADYTRKVAPFTSLVSVIGVDPSKALEATGALLAGDTSLSAQRAKLEQTLSEHPRRILVLIDDVDRLQSDELALVLKLVRLVGRLPHIYYVLAFDESTVLDVLQTTPVAAGRPTRALAYLDKIIQIRLDLPPAHPIQVSRMVDSALDQIVRRYGLVLTDADSARIASIYHDTMRVVLTEPRQIKRYFGQVDAFLALVHNEVDFVDFLLVSFVRTFFPGVYGLLRHYKDELTGSEMVPRTLSPDDRVAMWRQRLTSVADISHLDIIFSVLSVLFPPIAAARRGGPEGFHPHSELALGRRAASSEYFDRYFYLMVPPNDVSDAQVHQALAELVNGHSADSTEAVLRLMPVASEAILDKLRRFTPRDPKSARSLLRFAAEMVVRAPELGLLKRTGIVARSWLSELVGTADLARPEEVLTELLTVIPLYDLGDALRRVQKARAERGDDLTADQAAFRTLVLDALLAELETQAQREADETEGVVGLLSLWKELSDREGPREWFRTVLGTSPWKLETVVALFVPVATILGTDIRRLSGFNAGLLDELLGIDFVLQSFTPSPAPSVDDLGDWLDESDTSFSNRIRLAHAELWRISNERSPSPAERPILGQPDGMSDSSPPAR